MHQNDGPCNGLMCDCQRPTVNGYPDVSHVQRGSSLVQRLPGQHLEARRGHVGENEGGAASVPWVPIKSFPVVAVGPSKYATKLFVMTPVALIAGLMHSGAGRPPPPPS
eukprot:gene24902-biopygen20928